MRVLSTAPICLGVLILSAAAGAKFQMTESRSSEPFDQSSAFGNRQVLRQFDLDTNEPVHALAWSPDSKRILILTGQGSHAAIYNVASRQLEDDFDPSEHLVTARSAVLTNDGLVVTTFSSPAKGRYGNISIKRLALFDSRTGKPVRIYSFAGDGKPDQVSVSDFQPSPSGKFVAAFGAATFGMATREEMRTKPLNERFPVKVFNVATGAVVGHVEADDMTTPSAPRSISFLPGETKVVVLFWSGAVAIVDLSSGKSVSRFTMCGWGGSTIAASPNGRLLVASHNACAVGSVQGPIVVGYPYAAPEIRSLPTGTIRSALKADSDGEGARLAYASWNPRGDSLAIADTGTVNIWDKVSTKPQLTFVRHRPANEPPGRDVVTALSYSQSGILAVAVGSHVILYR